MSVAVLLCDQHDRELLEPQRDVEPPEAEVVGVRRPTGRLAVPDRPDAPRPVTAAEPGVRVDRELLAACAQAAGPGAELREPPGVDDRPPTGTQVVALLVDRGERAVP